MVDDLVDGDFIEVITNKLNASDDRIIRCALMTIDSILLLGRSKDRGDYSPVFQGSHIAALEGHEEEDIRKLSSRIVMVWYPDLSWKVVEKRSKNTKHKRSFKK